VKLLRRAPREVYRVYDAEEFLERADLELDAEGHSRGGVVGVAGGLVLLLGMLSVLTGLFASHRRVPVRAAARQTFRGSRTLRAAISLGMGDVHTRASHSISRRGALPGASGPTANGSSARRSRREPVKGTGRGHAGSRPAVSPMLPSHEVVSSPTGGHLLVAAAPKEGEQHQGEFGFER
jgi:hypothetical protein